MFGDWGKKAYEWAGFANPKQFDEARKEPIEWDALWTILHSNWEGGCAR
jgi:hypothetical protein